MKSVKIGRKSVDQLVTLVQNVLSGKILLGLGVSLISTILLPAEVSGNECLPEGVVAQGASLLHTALRKSRCFITATHQFIAFHVYHCHAEFVRIE